MPPPHSTKEKIMGNSKRVHRKKYEYIRTAEGGLYIKPAVPGDIGDEDIDQIISKVDAHLRLKNLTNRLEFRQKSRHEPGTYITNKNGLEIEVDPIAYRLETFRIAAGFTRRQVADALMMGVAELNGIWSGTTRARMDILRPLALLFGMRIMLVPKALSGTFTGMIAAWEKRELAKLEESEGDIIPGVHDAPEETDGVPRTES